MNRIARYENVQNTDEILSRYALLQSALSVFPKRLNQLYAIPKSPEPGVVEWYSPIPGQPIPYSALTDAEKATVTHNLKEALDAIKMASSTTIGEESKSILSLVSNQPIASSLYAINGTPVIALGEQIRVPPPPPPPPVVEEPIVPVPPPVPPVAKRGCLLPLLLLLLLLLLLAVAGYFLWDYWKKNGHFPFMETKEEIVHADLNNAPATLSFEDTKSKLPLILADIPKPPEPPKVEEPVPPKEEPIKEEPKKEDPVKEEPKVEEPKPKEPPKEVVKEKPKEPTPAEKKLAECKIKKKKKQEEKIDVQLVFDASYSMMINMNATPEAIDLWEQDIIIPGIEDEPRRVSVAKEASINMVKKLPNHINVGLVTAYGCNDLASVNAVPANKRASLISNINAIQPKGGTALADGLTIAGNKLNPAKESMIVVISDGKETCGGDPCAVARALANSHPKLKINVIDIMGAGAGYCLAEATKGRVFTAKNTNEINSMLKAATKELEDIDCE